MKYESRFLDKALSMPPVLVCPHCLVPAQELDSGKVLCSRIGEPADTVYYLHPCGCMVSREWAASFMSEVNRRKEGEVPRALTALTPAQAEARLELLRRQLIDYWSRIDSATGSERSVAEKALCDVIALMQALAPNDVHGLPAVHMSDATQTWARKNKMRLPPPPKARPSRDLTFPNAADFMPHDGQLSAQAILDMVQAGMIGPEAARQMLEANSPRPAPAVTLPAPDNLREVILRVIDRMEQPASLYAVVPAHSRVTVLGPGSPRHWLEASQRQLRKFLEENTLPEQEVLDFLERLVQSDTWCSRRVAGPVQAPLPPDLVEKVKALSKKHRDLARVDFMGQFKRPRRILRNLGKRGAT